MKLNERLKWFRNSKKLTQTELGDILGYGYTAISNYESGRNEPSIENLIKLSKFFNTTVDYLIGNDDIEFCDNKIDMSKTCECGNKYLYCSKCGKRLEYN